MTDLDERTVFVRADRALGRVVAQVRDDQWDVPMPPDFARRRSDQVPTLREIVGYHAYDDAWVPDMVAGRTMDEVGRDRYGPDLLGDDPRRAFATLVDRACDAVAALDDLDRTVHCSFGDFTAREYLWQVTMFRGLRAHDLALVVGLEPDLEPELVDGLWTEIEPHAEEWRAIGVLPPRVTVRDDAAPLDRLLGLTGRHPR
jgi:uncharacterized protein (TIGR03086 family)